MYIYRQANAQRDNKPSSRAMSEKKSSDDFENREVPAMTITVNSTDRFKNTSCQFGMEDRGAVCRANLRDTRVRAMVASKAILSTESKPQAVKFIEVTTKMRRNPFQPCCILFYWRKV